MAYASQVDEPKKRKRDELPRNRGTKVQRVSPVNSLLDDLISESHQLLAVTLDCPVNAMGFKPKEKTFHEWQQNQEWLEKVLMLTQSDSSTDSALNGSEDLEAIQEKLTALQNELYAESNLNLVRKLYDNRLVTDPLLLESLQLASQSGNEATHYQLVQLLAQRCEHVVQYLALSKKKQASEEDLTKLEEVNIELQKSIREKYRLLEGMSQKLSTQSSLDDMELLNQQHAALKNQHAIYCNVIYRIVLASKIDWSEDNKLKSLMMNISQEI